MRIVRRISAIIIGFVFFVAGLLKLMDPVGAGLVVEEYFKFLHLGFLRPLSYFTGAAGALAETLLGAALLCGVWRRLTGIVTLAVLGAFTILTLVLLIFNPSMDCGCFGEAVHLTHLQSFLKNIALLALWAAAFLPTGNQEPTRKVKYVSFCITGVSVCLFFLYSSLSIPLVDFTNYKSGSELTGEGLSFSDAGGEYADSLALEDRVLISSVYDPAKLSDKSWDKIADLLRKASETGYTPLLLAASYPEEMSELAGPEVLPYTYFADRKTLLTLNRSNGGLCYAADGQIISKWSLNRPPKREELQSMLQTDPTETIITRTSSDRLKLQGFLLYVFAVMLLL